MIELDCDEKINLGHYSAAKLALKAVWNKTVRTNATEDLPDDRRLKFIPSDSDRNDRCAVGELCLA